ncbi:MAG: hypothetical protein RBS99_09255 [Rhodospirillales bacterium]|jgi:hypothetical protein|nr:hypothetical protein [Rhodospirillales bacterium]
MQRRSAREATLHLDVDGDRADPTGLAGAPDAFFERAQELCAGGLHRNWRALPHPVEARVVRRAVSVDPDDPAAAVSAAQCWIWQCTKDQLRASLAAGMRQGDILLVRAHAPKGGEDVGSGFAVGGSHVIRADRVVQTADGRVFALNPTLEHTKNQHVAVYADTDGWFSVRAGREAPAWDFSPRFGD